MVTRREIEQMILSALGEIRTLEQKLVRSFGTLANARQEARLEFRSSLQDLDRQTTRLEMLIETLGNAIAA